MRYRLHKVWETNLTFDLDLWPTDLNINRDHLLTKDYLPTKFEASWAKRSWVISCTILKNVNIPTDRLVQSNTMYAHPSSKWRGNKAVEFKTTCTRQICCPLHNIYSYYFMNSVQTWLFNTLSNWSHKKLNKADAPKDIRNSKLYPIWNHILA